MKELKSYYIEQWLYAQRHIENLRYTVRKRKMEIDRIEKEIVQAEKQASGLRLFTIGITDPVQEYIDEKNRKEADSGRENKEGT
jgi:hypothetical protein